MQHEHGRQKVNSGNSKHSESARAKLIDCLNDDLAGELQAISMYIQYSALLRGVNRKELRDLFQAEIPDEQRHAQLLADKVAVLGGTPTTKPRPVPEAHETVEMLRHVLEAETKAVADYIERTRQAEEAGEIGLKVALEDVVVDETRHKEELEQILAGWHEDHTEERTSERRTTQLAHPKG